MSTANSAPAAHPSLEGIHPHRLFVASCMSLVSTAVAFGVLTSNMDQFKDHFALTNTEVGWVRGATIFGFTISIFLLGPLVDVMGMRLQMRIAFLCHLLGTLAMVFANGFWVLLAGGLMIALGNGTVEAACNPLVATLFPDRKTTKLNQFHVWFPGGIVIGGLIAYLLTNSVFKVSPENPNPKVLGLVGWQFKLMLVLAPTLLYGILFTGQKFPKTERVQSGVTFGQMFVAALNPLFLLMLLCMCLTASLELGPGAWMETAMKGVMSFAGDGAGILVLVWGTGLMAVLRFFAGPVVHRLAPPGILFTSAVLGGVGLFLLSTVNAPAMVIVAATIFYVGVCYFWPTMLGFVAERLPKTGALGLALMGGTGMLFVGLVTAPLMGRIGDTYLHERLAEAENAPKAVAAIKAAAEQYPVLLADKDLLDMKADRITGLEEAIKGTTKDGKMVVGARDLVAGYEKEKTFVAVDADRVIRALIQHAPAIKPADQLKEEQRKAAELARATAGTVARDLKEAISGPDNYGMRMGFRWTSVMAVPLLVVFGGLLVYFLSAGGYRAKTIAGDAH